MAKALGIGGVFFKSKDPEGLATWYRTWLSFPEGQGHFSFFHPGPVPENGGTVWSPFEESTDYFGKTPQKFMINIMVDDLEEALKQVGEGGAEVIQKTEDYEYGRFGWFVDPEGNRVELWEPAKT